MPIPPIVIEWLVKLVLVGVLLGATYYEGHKHGAQAAEMQLKDYKESVLQATVKQQAKVQQAMTEQANVSSEVESDYQTRLNSLRAGYEWLSAHPTTVTHVVSPLPSSPRGADGKAPDPLPAQPAPIAVVIPDDALKLAMDCSITTQQLVSLQDWVNKEDALP